MKIPFRYRGVISKPALNAGELLITGTVVWDRMDHEGLKLQIASLHHHKHPSLWQWIEVTNTVTGTVVYSRNSPSDFRILESAKDFPVIGPSPAPLTPINKGPSLSVVPPPSPVTPPGPVKLGDKRGYALYKAGS